MRMRFHATLTQQLLLVFLMCVCHKSQADTSPSKYSMMTMEEAYIQLRQHLLSKQSIIHRVPPPAYGSNEISLSFTPFQVLNVDEIQQSVDLSSMIIMSWRLNNSLWQPADYNGLHGLFVDSDLMWTPTVLTPKAITNPKIEMPSSILVNYDGTLVVYIPGKLSTLCYLDLANYPFDAHTCTVAFVEPSGFVEVVPDNFLPSYTISGLSKYFSTSAEWMLEGSSCKLIQPQRQGFSKYTECRITIKRRSIFYTVTIVVPLIFMSYMTLIVFWVPAESGEKISYVVSIFVSMTVFINFVIDVIPRSTDQLPRLVYLVTLVTANAGLVAAATAHVLNRYHQQAKNQEMDCQGETGEEECANTNRRRGQKRNCVHPGNGSDFKAGCKKHALQEPKANSMRYLEPSRDNTRACLEDLELNSDTQEMTKQSGEANGMIFFTQQDRGGELESGNPSVSQTQRGGVNFWLRTYDDKRLDRMYFTAFIIVSSFTESCGIRGRKFAFAAANNRDDRDLAGFLNA
ncbi:acetylcholine receptor subunit alpha-1-B [Aplysia californica]|uniref:Acetylcholine receptor subunit alpha-1-B n=1 Tax=Aplysia californica TaxID=6500 RepID=A0ABM0JG36_APLCA|nr:acetylcholine receptor subunit alpha-1-B [Aplysia californica]